MTKLFKIYDSPDEWLAIGCRQANIPKITWTDQWTNRREDNEISIVTFAQEVVLSFQPFVPVIKASDRVSTQFDKLTRLLMWIKHWREVKVSETSSSLFLCLLLSMWWISVMFDVIQLTLSKHVQCGHLKLTCYY